MEDDKLRLSFTDGLSIVVFDDGQSCSEHRYMTTDDNLQEFIGATFNEFELAEAPSVPTEDEFGNDEHEVQFLNGKTSKGVFTLETHNEHNGYYGGFWIVIREVEQT